MSNISLSFRISANETAENIISFMNNKYKIYKRTATTYIMLGNIIEIYSNNDYDKILSADDEDGYLYYRTYMDFYPIDEVTLTSQISLAKNVKHFFDILGWKSEIIAEFEMLIFNIKEQITKICGQYVLTANFVYHYNNRPPRKLTYTVCQIFCHMAALSSSEGVSPLSSSALPYDKIFSHTAAP